MLEYLVFDLETAPAPQEAIDLELALWKPSASTKKEETVERQRAEAAVKIRERSALLDDAPISCVALHSQTGNLVFHCLPNVPDGPPNFKYPSELVMLQALRQWLDGFVGPETLLVGFNVVGFDLPHLRWAYVRHGLRLPLCLNPANDQPVCDVMRLFSRFTKRDTPFISLDEVAQRLRIGSKNGVTGKLAADWVAEGRHTEIVQYCLSDTLLTASAWLKLTGQVGA